MRRQCACSVRTNATRTRITSTTGFLELIAPSEHSNRSIALHSPQQLMRSTRDADSITLQPVILGATFQGVTSSFEPAFTDDPSTVSRTSIPVGFVGPPESTAQPASPSSPRLAAHVVTGCKTTVNGYANSRRDVPVDTHRALRRCDQDAGPCCRPCPKSVAAFNDSPTRNRRRRDRTIPTGTDARPSTSTGDDLAATNRYGGRNQYAIEVGDTRDTVPRRGVRWQSGGRL